ncbi:Sterol O-acyltransferase 1 [Dinochytrium kinnereticum]|nr:Sterol O-acyltransferase 1 [Dinochytrium kinnereticum]
MSQTDDGGLRQRRGNGSDAAAAATGANDPAKLSGMQEIDAKDRGLTGYMPLQRRIDELIVEKEELQRFLKEQASGLLERFVLYVFGNSLQHLDHVRENVAQIVNNVDQLHETSLAKIRQFDKDFRQGHEALQKKHRVETKPVEHKAPVGKVFRARDSRLNVLLQIKDIATVYNIFVAILPILFVSLAVQSYYETGQFIDFSLMFNSFRRMDIVVSAWVGFFFFAVSGYFWKHSSKILSQKVEFLLYIIYQTTFALTAAYITLKFKLPPASGFIIMCEQARMSMKIHSFWREHSASAWKMDAEAGTKPGVRLGSVGLSHFLYIYILFKRFLFPIVQIPMHANQDDLKVFLIMAMNSMFPSMVLFVFGFFGILHCWLNLWAELLQFADREFYRDWWNSHSFSEYYRKWNGVVYDWLFAYIYMDAVKFLEARYKKSTAKILSVIFVIEVSAIIHEFILACALGYCFPVLLLMYGGPGLIFAQLNKSQQRELVCW